MKSILLPHSIIRLMAVIAVAVATDYSYAQEMTPTQIKAAQLYKFLLFTEWDSEVTLKSEDTIMIGLLGNDIFGDLFKPIIGQTVKDRTLVVKKFPTDTPQEELKTCDMIFFIKYDDTQHHSLLETLATEHILTVGDQKEFLETGGMINLIESKNTIQFEVNQPLAKKNGLMFRSQLLQYAVRTDPDDTKSTRRKR